MKTNTSSASGGSASFLSKLTGKASGILHGFDRLRLRGTLRPLYAADVMETYLGVQHILLKDFGAFMEKTSASVRAAAHAFAESWRRPEQYLNSSQVSKEQLARQIARRDKVEQGLIAVFSAVEPCRSFRLVGHRETKHLALKLEARKCQHLYFYFEHERFGFMHVRLQTWFPFQIDVCLNGRHWLARELEREGVAFRKRENAILWCEDMAKAQQLLDAQTGIPWCRELDALVGLVHPRHEQIRRPLDLHYYWTASESEYASDVLFTRPEDLAAIYPSLVHHALRSFSSPDVMRFLGRSVGTSGHVSKQFQGEIISDLKHRPEGIRVKHSVDGNSLKLYDKQGSVLRVETTITRPAEFKVFRSNLGAEPGAPKSWRELPRSVQEMPRRVEVCRAANERYFQALAATSGTIPLFAWAKEACEPVRREGRRYRALNPFAGADAALLEAVNRGEFVLHGFRNHDLCALLYPSQAGGTKAARARSAATRRRILVLRTHGLVRKVGSTRRYVVTEKGRTTIVALLTTRRADVDRLTQIAA